MKEIYSHQNPKIKNILLLQEKSRERRIQNLFVVEGNKELDMAISAGYQLKQFFFCPDMYPSSMPEAADAEYYCISKAVFEKIAYRENSGGFIALFKPKLHTLSSLLLPENPLILVMERMEKPGNIGAMLRTADAAGVDAVIICEPISDLYNPNTIRSSVGGIFTILIAEASTPEAITYLKKHKVTINVTSLEAAQSLFNTNLLGANAIIMGEEQNGISLHWQEAADRRIIIPMAGKVDSMNVSVSTGICLFEARRQRNKPALIVR